MTELGFIKDMTLPNVKLGLIKQTNLMKKISTQDNKSNINNRYYLVRYQGGEYEDYYEKVIFVTNKKSTATKYVTKFNGILKKWKKYYEQFETTKYGMKWIADEYVQQHFDRWHSLQNISKSYYEEVIFR